MFYKSFLLKEIKGPKIKYYNYAASTNAVAKEYSKTAQSDCVFIAKTQTGGKGRKQRNFYSPKGGIYFSLVVKENTTNEIPQITALAAVAVLNAIKKLNPNINPQIKWVNDIYINNKKVCGILCEKISTLKYTVIGIGINTAKPKNIPDDIKDIYGFINQKVSYKYNAKLIAEIINEIYTLINNGNFYETYLKHSLCIDKEVTVITETESFKAVAKNIEKDFSLTLLKENELINLSSGEISIKL